MSTYINVNVDQAALLQRSREQTQANRLGFLEGQNRKKVEAEARRQRELNRAKDGKDANGNLYNNRLRQLPQRPDPAAWRTATDSLPYFYWKTEPGVFRFLSGDGSDALTVQVQITDLDPPLIPLRDSIAASLPPLINTVPIDSSWTTTQPNSYGLTSTHHLTDTPTQVRTETYDVRRYIDALTTGLRIFLFPLGDGTTLWVYYMRQNWTAGRAVYHEIRNNVFTQVVQLEVSTYDFITEISLGKRTEVIAVRAGFNSVERVAPPEQLVAAIEAMLAEVTVGQAPITVQIAQCEAFLTGHNNCVGFPIGNGFTTQRTVVEVDNGPNVAPSVSYLSRGYGYGITDQGYVPDFQSTPSVWFALASRANDKWSFDHQHFSLSTQLDPAGTATFASLFTPNKYIGLPGTALSAASDLTLPGNTAVWKWTGTDYMTGDYYNQAYPYTDSRWKLSATKVKPTTATNPTPDEYWNRSYIYDWGQPAFCKERASVYGIFPLEPIP